MKHPIWMFFPILKCHARDSFGERKRARRDCHFISFVECFWGHRFVISIRACSAWLSDIYPGRSNWSRSIIWSHRGYRSALKICLDSLTWRLSLRQSSEHWSEFCCIKWPLLNCSKKSPDTSINQLPWRASVSITLFPPFFMKKILPHFFFDITFQKSNHKFFWLLIWFSKFQNLLILFLIVFWQSVFFLIKKHSFVLTFFCIKKVVSVLNLT